MRHQLQELEQINPSHRHYLLAQGQHCHEICHPLAQKYQQEVNDDMVRGYNAGFHTRIP